MRTWIVAFSILCCSTASFAQVAEFSVSGGRSIISSRDLGSGYSLADGTRMGFRVTLNNQKFFGHEFGYAYNRTHLNFNGQDQGGMAIHQGLYHFLAYATPEGKHVRPFVSGGGHFSNFVPPGASATQGQGETKFGVNYGAGVKFRLTEKFMLRFDAKQYLNPKPFNLPGKTGQLKLNELSIGLAFYLL
ncbi:MAG TPA: porin family protein [Bryobacteraceae bacterium]|nr:porin family protein [Bryobacteraceae bacterium]